MTSVIFWGATGQARVLREALPDDMSLIAVFDNQETGSPFPDVPIFYGEAGFLRWHKGYAGDRPVCFCVAIGGAHGRDRVSRANWLRARGYKACTVIHRTAFIAADAQLGDACQILAMSAVCANTRLGTSVIVNTKASVDHDCVLGDGVHVGPGAILAGEIIVDDFAFIGAGATVLPRIRIGKAAIVGAGAVVTRDVGDGVVVVGSPAHPCRKDQS